MEKLEIEEKIFQINFIFINSKNTISAENKSPNLERYFDEFQNKKF